MKVPFLDLKAGYLELRDELDAAYQRVMNSGWYILGEEVEAFEQEFAEYCGVEHCVGVSNGLDALRLILEAYEIGPGDEVIVPAHTFIATWLAVSQVGAKPVPVEPDIGTCNIDPDLIKAAISKRSRAIVPVHLYGQPADMDPITQLAEDHELIVIEDAAQAHGACYKGRRAGALGHAAAFSFYPGKNLGAFGDGGAVTTDDAVLTQRIRILQNYGSEKKYEHVARGGNCRLDALQAAFLRVRLAHLDNWNVRRKRIARRYLEDLAGIGHIKLPGTLNVTDPVWHLFTVRSGQRDALRERLAAEGVETLVHYPVPPHASEAYRADYGHLDLGLAASISENILSLPIGPHQSEAQTRSVIEFLEEF